MAPSFLCECHINMSPRKTKSIFRPIRLAALLMSQLFQADDGSDHDIYTGSKTAASSSGSHVHGNSISRSESPQKDSKAFRLSWQLPPGVVNCICRIPFVRFPLLITDIFLLDSGAPAFVTCQLNTRNQICNQ